MSKHVQTPTGPLAPPDNPIPAASTSNINPTTHVGKYHQFLPVDLVDPVSHRVPEGGPVGEGGHFVGTEVISPNEMKAIRTAGLQVVVNEAYMLQQRRNLALDQLSAVPTDVGLEILDPSALSDGNSVHAVNAQVQDTPLSHTGDLPAVHHLPRLKAGILAENFGDNPDLTNKVEDWVDETPLRLDNNPQEGNSSGYNLSHAQVVQSACDIRIHWDEFGGISEISAPTREVADLLCAKLKTALSDGKDSILKAISEGNTDDAAKILEAAEFDALQGYEGYSHYDSLEAFTTLNDPRIGLEDIEIANLSTVTAAVLSAGPGTQAAVSKGEWPLILNWDSWFRFLITVLSGAARAGARFKDLPSMGDFPLNADNLVLGDDLPMPGSQTEMVKRLLEQIYAQFDARNDYEALQECASHIQNQILEKFEWLVRARVGVKCAFLSEYFSENSLKDIMERILMEEPLPELTEFIKKAWRDQGAVDAEKVRGRVTNDAYREALEKFAMVGEDLAAAHANTDDKGKRIVLHENRMRTLAAAHDAEMKALEETFANQYRVQKQARTQWYSQLEEADQAAHIRKEALAMGLIEHEELREPAVKRACPTQTPRSASVASVKKRGRSVSRSEDIEYINKFAPSQIPPTKAKDGSITPTKASGQVRAASAIRKEPPAPGMAVDVTVPIIPHTISRTMTPLPPAPAELPPAVIPQQMDTWEDKSPSPAISDTASDRIEMALRGIDRTLMLIMERIERLELKDSISPKPKPTAPSPSPPPIPAALKGKGRADPAIPLPKSEPPLTTTTPIGKSLMAQIGEGIMRKAGASEELIKEQVTLVDKNYPPLPSSNAPSKGIQRPLFTSVVMSGPSDGFQKVQRKSPPIKMQTTRFVRAGAQTSTEITISRNGGLGGMEEELFQRSTPVESIIREAQTNLNKVSVSAPRIIKGRFSTRAANNGNFVFTLQGRFSPKEIQGFEESLCGPFPGPCIAIPADGWMFTHLRSVPTKDGRGNVWSHDDLFNALAENACFQGVCLTVPPRWLHDSYVTSSMEKATVTFAYIDDDLGSITKNASKSKLAMFGEFVPFIPVGDKAVSQQCTKCWKLGHVTRYCTSATELCFVCNGSHEGSPHNFHCAAKTHKTLGICDCKLTCSVCKGEGHTARAIKCPLKPNVPIPKAFWNKVKRGLVDPNTGLDTAGAPKPSRPKTHDSKGVPNFAAFTNADGVKEISLAVKYRRKLIRKAITHKCANDSTKNNLQCLCCAPPKIGWSILYDDPSEERFADLLGLDESLADTIIEEAKSHPSSDHEDSVYSRFSRIRVRIVGNDTVKFNREGKMMSEEETAVEEALNKNDDMEAGDNSVVFPHVLNKLTPAQQAWCYEWTTRVTRLESCCSDRGGF